MGRIATHSPEAEALRAATQRRQIAARKAWRASDKPEWLTKEFYSEKIQPRLQALRKFGSCFCSNREHALCGGDSSWTTPPASEALAGTGETCGHFVKCG
jgi:hypothetical protein